MINDILTIKSAQSKFILCLCVFLTACGSENNTVTNSQHNNTAEEVSEETVDRRVVLTEITLTADGDNTGTNTYDIIQNVLAVGSIESPDLYAINHQGAGQHIIQSTDEAVGHYFIFLAHRDLDSDRDKDTTDRQRNEIKAFGNSVNALKGFEDETMQFTWKLKILSEMELSSKFTHFFQLKAVNSSETFANGNDEQPIITLSGAEKSSTGNTLQVRHNEGHDINGNSTITDYIYQESNGWNDLIDEWVEIFVEAKFSEQGKFKFTMTRLGDKKVIIDIDKTDIDMWRGNDSGDFVRPKWGIYRSIAEKDSLRADEEQVFFADFSIKKIL